MPSLIWTTVYWFLLAELALTAVLVVPVPRRVRNSIAKSIFKFNLGERLSKPVLFIGLALAFGLLESYLRHSHVLERMAEGELHHEGGDHHFHSPHHHDKEKKYKAERNMYLSGFSLTLIFVIGRLTTLMQENVELDHEAHPEKATEIEMVKPKDKAEKKND